MKFIYKFLKLAIFTGVFGLVLINSSFATCVPNHNATCSPSCGKGQVCVQGCNGDTPTKPYCAIVP